MELFLICLLHQEKKLDWNIDYVELNTFWSKLGRICVFFMTLSLQLRPLRDDQNRRVSHIVNCTHHFNSLNSVVKLLTE